MKTWEWWRESNEEGALMIIRNQQKKNGTSKWSCDCNCKNLWYNWHNIDYQIVSMNKNMKKISLMMWVRVENFYKEITMSNFFNRKTRAKKSKQLKLNTLTFVLLVP
jgi:hypothetical protein